VLILAALLLFLYNQWQAQSAYKFSQEALTQVQQVIAQTQDTAEPQGEPEESPQAAVTTQPQPSDPTMTEVEIDGYGYIGYLSIPALDLELPVLSTWDYTRLKIAPCRYSGSTKSDDLVIAAHNYARHFGKLSQLRTGDQVIFTDMDGVVTAYQVVAVEVLQPTAIEEVTSGAFDLTLITCTYGGKSRVTVRCDRITE
jgi:sortase A